MGDKFNIPYRDLKYLHNPSKIEGKADDENMILYIKAGEVSNGNIPAKFYELAEAQTVYSVRKKKALKLEGKHVLAIQVTVANILEYEKRLGLDPEKDYYIPTRYYKDMLQYVFAEAVPISQT